MNRKHQTLITILFVAVVGFSGCGESKQQTEKAQAVAQAAVEQNANAAYAFSLQTLEGEPITLKGYEGKVLLLNIWDTWCPPCKAEIPDFIDLYDTYRNQGLEILGVAGGRNGLQAVADFVKEYGINYPIALATQDLFVGFGGVNAIPTTFLIDQKGNIHKKYVGYREKQVFEQDINSLLN